MQHLMVRNRRLKVGEYAIDQMMSDYKRMTSIDADRSDFEDEPGKRRPKPMCPKCSKPFQSGQAVKDHLRDKHALPAVGAA